MYSNFTELLKVRVLSSASFARKPSALATAVFRMTVPDPIGSLAGTSAADSGHIVGVGGVGGGVREHVRPPRSVGKVLLLGKA